MISKLPATVIGILLVVSVMPVFAEDIHLELFMPGTMFGPGSPFSLDLSVENNGIAFSDAQLYVALTTGAGNFWFYPSWVQFPPAIDWDDVFVPGDASDHWAILPEFSWPYGAGTCDGAMFLAAILHHGDLISNLAETHFGWSETPRPTPTPAPPTPPPGAGYIQVVRLAAEFVRNAPVYEPLQLPMYFISCCFHEDENGTFIAGDWMHNPACVWAGLVQGLALNYRVFTGDDSYLELVRSMLDFHLENGTTPADWPWPNVPYASADPFETTYQGAQRWQEDGFRGDGLFGIEPDKIGELGMAYLTFYQITEEKRFLNAAVHCAETLAAHVRDVRPGPPPFSHSETHQSPWPFRVNAKTGEILSEYCSNVIEPIRLFDELLRLQGRIDLSNAQIQSFQRARSLAWLWLYSINGPMITFIWNGYFEDIPNDPDRSNRVQITPMETARYLIKNPELDPHLEVHVPALLHWVASAFSTEGMDAIREQTWCYAPMGSHTARYASICALWYERTGDEFYKDQAERFFNFATSVCRENGYVAVGPDWPGAWWSDGYGDYIRHFMEGIAAIPDWVSADEDHLLKSTSVIQEISYKSSEISYQIFDTSSTDVLRMTRKPEKILVNEHELSLSEQLDENTWTWTPAEQGGVLRIRHALGNTVIIKLPSDRNGKR
jgi:hypothetical protein